LHQVGKKDYHYIRMHGQQNIKNCAIIVLLQILPWQDCSWVLLSTPTRFGRVRMSTSTAWFRLSLPCTK